MPSTDESGLRPDSSPGNRGPKPALLALLLWACLFGLGWWAWHPLPIGVWHDDGAYVLVAESIASGHGLTWSGVAGTPPAAKFPPLFPAVASLVLRWGPETAAAATALARLNLALMALSGAVFFLFLVNALRMAPLLAVGASLVLWTAPGLWRLASVPLSEPLFTLACMTFLLIATHVQKRPRGWEAVWLLLAFAAAFYTRTVGIALLGALVLALAAEREWKRAVAYLAGGAVLVLPWVLWSRSATVVIPEPLRDVLGSYGGWLSGEMIRSPIAYTAFVAGNAWAVWTNLIAMAIPFAAGGFLTTLAVVLLPVGLMGIGALGRRCSTAAFFVAGYLLIVTLWPFQSARLVTPVFPLVALALALGALRAVREGRRRRYRPAVAVGLAALAGLFVVANLSELVRGGHLVDFDVRARALAAASEAVGSWVPEDGVVGAPELWAGLHIYTGRTVSPSARFLPLATEGPSWGTPDQQYRLWEVAGIDHILVEHGGGVHGAALDRLDATCPGGAVQLVATMPGAFLTRLGWDDTCRLDLGIGTTQGES